MNCLVWLFVLPPRRRRYQWGFIIGVCSILPVLTQLRRFSSRRRHSPVWPTSLIVHVVHVFESVQNTALFTHGQNLCGSIPTRYIVLEGSTQDQNQRGLLIILILVRRKCCYFLQAISLIGPLVSIPSVGLALISDLKNVSTEQKCTWIANQRVTTEKLLAKSLMKMCPWGLTPLHPEYPTWCFVEK